MMFKNITLLAVAFLASSAVTMPTADNESSIETITYGELMARPGNPDLHTNAVPYGPINPTDDNDKSTLRCNNFNHLAEAYWLGIQIDKVKHMKGKPSIRAGPDVCDKLACGGWTAVWWCNKSNKPQTLKNYKEISKKAEEIVKKCKRGDNYVDGEVIVDGKWSVIVMADYQQKCHP